MGWKGTLRSMQAAARRAEREAQRQQRQLQREHARIHKMRELELAAHEVALYENRVALLQSTHKECGDKWDWDGLAVLAPPEELSVSHTNENRARSILATCTPTFLDKLLRRVETQRSRLAEELEEAIRQDQSDYEHALRLFKDAKADWEETRDLASRILSGDSEAYLETIRETDPFADIQSLGSSFEFNVPDQRTIGAVFRVNADEVIPLETRSLLKSGKLSVKRIPTSKFNELYQDYVCSCVLRVAREILALLPVEFVIVTALGTLLDTRSGHIEEQPIVSAAIPRRTLERLNMASIDPSDSMSNFVHRMGFRKTKGFSAIAQVEPSELVSGLTGG